MSEMEELKEQVEALQKKVADQTARLGQQAALLGQARQDQREVLSMAKAVIEQQAKAPAACIYQERENVLIRLSS